MILRRRKEEILVGIIFGVSLFLNFYNLEYLPPAFHNDEAEHGLEALRILWGQTSPIGLSNFYHLSLSSFLHHSLAVLLFGQSVFGVRAASAFIGSLSLIFFFYLIKILFDQKVALLATLLFSFSHFWIAFSRFGANYNLSVLFMIITFIFLTKTIQKGHPKDSFLLGAFCATSLYLYFSSRIVPIIVAGVLAFSSRGRFSRSKPKVVFLALAGFLLTAFPMLLVFAKNPQGFKTRTKSVFVFSPEVRPWLQDVYKTDSEMKILALQVRRSLNLSSSNCESSGQYGYCGRILDIPTLVLFLLGMFLSFLRISHVRDFFLLFWFWMTMILGSFLTVPPLFMPRILGALPVVYVFASGGFYSLKSLLSQKLGRRNVRLKSLTDLVLIMVVVFIVFHNLTIYFLRYPDLIWGDSHKYTATRIGRIMGIYKNYQFIFLTSPFLSADFSTLVWLAPGTRRLGVEKPMDYSFDPEVQATIYVFYPHYYQKLAEARRIYPTGELIEVRVFSESPPSAWLLKVD